MTKPNPTFTVAAIEGRHATRMAENAIRRTQRFLPYPSKSLLISPHPPADRIDAWVWTPELGPLGPTSIRGLNDLHLRFLPTVIATDFVVLVQADGYAVHPEAWTDEFLDYDFIGPPWPIWLSLAMFTWRRWQLPRRVGCGGFCLRSKRWLDASLSLPDSDAGEDIFMQQHRDHFANRGCRVAPVSIALRWGVEFRLEDWPNWNPVNSFGIHGVQPNGTTLWDLGFIAGLFNVIRTSKRNQKLWEPFF